jgi:type IX secretion system PorP/SprF family membrane protein
LNIFALHRTQWVGLDGAPVTNTASINTPIKDTKLGLGVSIINDRIGPSDENNLAVDFPIISIHQRISSSLWTESISKPLNINFDKLNQYDPNDYSFENNIDNKFSPNIGVGLYWYSDNIGLSVPNLLETKHFDKYAE